MGKGSDVMTLGQKIYKLRTERKWSQEKLAEAVGVSRQAVSKWELGEAVPDVSNIISLSRIFNVSNDYLLIDEENNPSVKPSIKLNPKKIALVLFVLLIVTLPTYLFSIFYKYSFGNQKDFFDSIYQNDDLYTHFKTSCDVLDALDGIDNCLYVDMYNAENGLVVDVHFTNQKDSVYYDLSKLKVTAGECDVIPSNKKLYEKEMMSVLRSYYTNAYGEDVLSYLNEIDYDQASHIYINDTLSIITLNQESFLVQMNENVQLEKVNDTWSSLAEEHAAKWVYQYYHDGIIHSNDKTYYSKFANLSTLKYISPFICPENALYQISFEDDKTHVSFVGTDEVEIVAANHGVVREVKDCGDEGVYLRVTYADQSEIEYFHLSRNFWLSSETEIFYPGQLLGYAMADSESTCSFSFSLKLGPSNEIISLEEYCRNQINEAVRVNVFEVDTSLLFNKDAFDEIEEITNKAKVFKRIEPDKSVKVEGYGIVSEIFGKKTSGVSFSVSSHDIHTLLIHHTDRDVTAPRVIELESTLRGINGTAYSGEISLSPSMYYDGNSYQNITLSFRINGNQYAFYGDYDPVEQSFTPTDYSAPVLFPTDEVEEAIRTEIHRLYTEFYEIDQQLKDFSYQVLPYLTDAQDIEIYYPEFPAIAEEVY